MARTELWTGARVLPTLLAGMVIGLGVSTGASAQALSSFAILAGSTITNTNVSTVTGNIGLYPGTSAPGTGNSGANRIDLTGTLHINNGVAMQAKSDLTTAYNVLRGRPTTQDLTGETLGDLGTIPTLNAGVYNFATSVGLSGELTLNGGPNDIFIFKIGSTLITDSASSIVLGGTVNASNVFFVVGSAATLGTATDFAGQILALDAITLNTGATIDCGAAWARNGAVTMNTNTIDICTFTITPDTLGEALGGGASEDELAVRDALNDYVANGGILPLSYEVLALLTPDELARALSEMGGEVGGGTSPTIIQAMNSYLDVVFGRLGGSPGTVMVSREGTPPGMPDDDNTVSVMGYANESRPAPDSALASLGGIATEPLPRISEWTIWSSAYGTLSGTAGNDTTGARGTTTQDFGYAIGFDRHISADTLFGFSLAAGGTSFAVDEDLGTGSSAMLQAALYGRQSIDLAYVSAVLSYARHQNVTRRSVTIGGVDQYRAEFASNAIAGAIEVGYDMGWFTPYGALRGQLVATPGYSETTVSGVDTFALDYDARLALAARTEIGVRFDWSNAIESGTISLTSSIAWAHDLSGTNAVNASFQALGDGSSFAVNGATPASDSILLAAGIGAAFDNGFDVSSALNASLATNSSTYGASLRIGYSW